MSVSLIVTVLLSQVEGAIRITYQECRVGCLQAVGVGVLYSWMFAEMLKL